MLVLLALNGIELNYKQEELYTIILDIASGAAELNDLTEWILTTLMKTKTEFLVICFLTGFSVCFLFCGVCSYLSDSG